MTTNKHELLRKRVLEALTALRPIRPEPGDIEVICEETGEGFELVKVVEHEGTFRFVIKRESSDETV